jgi:hypothetical protein
MGLSILDKEKKGSNQAPQITGKSIVELRKGEHFGAYEVPSGT